MTPASTGILTYFQKSGCENIDSSIPKQAPLPEDTNRADRRGHPVCRAGGADSHRPLPPAAFAALAPVTPANDPAGTARSIAAWTPKLRHRRRILRHLWVDPTSCVYNEA